MSMSEKDIKRVFVDWVGYIVNVMLAVVYIMVESLTAGYNNINVLDLILGSILYFVISASMRTSMWKTGIHKGYSSDQWKNTASKHEERIIESLPHCEYLQEYLDEDYQKRLKAQRVACLRGISYNKIFEDDGSIKDYQHELPKLDGLNKQQQRERMATYRAECRSIRKARRVSVPLYHSDQLFTRSKSNRRKYTVSIKKSTAQVTVGGLVLSIMTAVMSRLFAPGEFLVAKFFIALGMSLLAVACAFISLYRGYVLITQSLREDVIDKTNDLGAFLEWVKKNKVKGNLQNGQNAENNQVGA